MKDIDWPALTIFKHDVDGWLTWDKDVNVVKSAETALAAGATPTNIASSMGAPSVAGAAPAAQSMTTGGAATMGGAATGAGSAGWSATGCGRMKMWPCDNAAGAAQRLMEVQDDWGEGSGEPSAGA